MLGEVTPCNIAAAGVHRLGHVLLLKSNQQSSRPLRRLLWASSTPHGPFSGLAWKSRYNQSDPQDRDTRGVARPKPWLARGAG